MDFLGYLYANLGISQWLDTPGVTEICINKPGHCFVEINGQWHSHAQPSMTMDALRGFCTAIVNESRTGQRITEKEPLVSLTFPGGQRAQLVIPPACEAGSVSVTIRVPGQRTTTLEQYASQGFFGRIRESRNLPSSHAHLRELARKEQWVAFFRYCVESRQNIVVAGATASGKTSFMKSLIQCIPLHERLITIEDARELFLEHRNAVHLLYAKGIADSSAVTARQCMEACLRMRPDRILLAELRGDEVFHYLRGCASGHPGSITSCHAGSATQAWEQLALMIKASPEGATLDMRTIHSLLKSSIDVMVHVANVGGIRRITGVSLTDLEGEEAMSAVSG